VEANPEMMWYSFPKEEWTMFQGNLPRTGYTTNFNPPELVKLWNFTADNHVASPITVSDGIIYFGTDSGSVYAVYANMTQKWKYKITDATNTSYVGNAPTIDNGIVYFGGGSTVGAGDKSLHALYAENGTAAWSYLTGDSIVGSSAAIYDDTVYIGSYDSNLYAVYTNGTLRWSFAATNWMTSSPTISNGVVFIGSRDGYLYAVYANNGTQKWSFATGDRIYDAPLIDDGIVYFGSNDNKFYAVYENNGTQKWSYDTGYDMTAGSVLLDDTVYFSTDSNSTFALYKENGTLKWNLSLVGAGNCLRTPVISDGVIYVGSIGKQFYAIYTNGTVKWNYTVSDAIWSTPAVAGGVVYIGSHDNNTYAFGDGTSTNSFVRTISLPYGSHEIEILSRDTSGNYNTSAVYFTIKSKQLTSCSNLDVPDSTYYLMNDIDTTSPACFNITASNIIFDGNGYKINMHNVSTAAFVFNLSNNTNDIIIMNVTILLTNYTGSGNKIGIYSSDTSKNMRINITNVTIVGSYRANEYGIYIGGGGTASRSDEYINIDGVNMSYINFAVHSTGNAYNVTVINSYFTRIWASGTSVCTPFYFGTAGNNNWSVYNNIFECKNDVTFLNPSLPASISFNTTIDCSRPNIAGGRCIGGNYYMRIYDIGGYDINIGKWTTVTDLDGDGIGDYRTVAFAAPRVVDYLPLTNFTLNVSSCGELYIDNQTYRLVSNVTSLLGNCIMRIKSSIYGSGSNITLEGNGYSIIHSGGTTPPQSIGHPISAVNNTVLNNVTIIQGNQSNILSFGILSGNEAFNHNITNVIFGWNRVSVRLQPNRLDSYNFLFENIMNSSDMGSWYIRNHSGLIIRNAILPQNLDLVTSTNVYLINTTVPIINNSLNSSKYYRQWNVIYRIIDQNGNPVNADVNIEDAFSALKYSKTASSDTTPQTQYYDNLGSITVYEPYTISASAIGYVTNSTSFNFSSDAIIILQIDKIPTITIYSPQNITYNSITINLETSADETIDTWWYSLNGETNTTFTPNSTIAAAEGSNKIIVYANDTLGNLNSTSISFTFTPISIPPTPIINIGEIILGSAMGLIVSAAVILNILSAFALVRDEGISAESARKFLVIMATSVVVVVFVASLL
jgi:outer membrane protein assembly factor BamB